MRRVSLSQNYQNASACQFLGNACVLNYASRTIGACTLLNSGPTGANPPSTSSNFPDWCAIGVYSYAGHRPGPASEYFE